MTEKDIEEVGQQYFDTIPKSENNRPVQQNVELLLEDLGENDVYESNRTIKNLRKRKINNQKLFTLVPLSTHVQNHSCRCLRDEGEDEDALDLDI